MAAEPPASWEQRCEEGADGGLSTKDASQTRLARTMHEGTDFHGHACKFGDVVA